MLSSKKSWSDDVALPMDRGDPQFSSFMRPDRRPEDLNIPGGGPEGGVFPETPGKSGNIIDLSADKDREGLFPFLDREVAMQYTERKLVEFRALFALRRRRQLLVSLPLIALIMGFAFLEKSNTGAFLGIPPSIVLPGFLAMIAGAVVFSLYNWRCPACNKYLGKQRSPKYCSKCGVELQ
jgi:hypothetical protein